MSRPGYSGSDLARIRAVADRLYSDPSVKNHTPLVAEAIITGFLERNISAFRDITIKSGFLPHIEFNSIFELILEALEERALEGILPTVTGFIQGADFSFFDRSSAAGSVDENFRKSSLYALFRTIFTCRDGRYFLNGPVHIIGHGIIEKYIGGIFSGSHGIFTAVTENSLNLQQSDYITCLKAMTIIRNIVHVPFFDPSENQTPDACFNNSGLSDVPDEDTEYLAVRASGLLPGFNLSLVRSSIISSRHGEAFRRGDTEAGIVSILCDRYHNCGMLPGHDGAAEPPDKSWFGTAMNNGLFAGYDTAILGCLYRVASDNDW